MEHVSLKPYLELRQAILDLREMTKNSHASPVLALSVNGPDGFRAGADTYAHQILEILTNKNNLALPQSWPFRDAFEDWRLSLTTVANALASGRIEEGENETRYLTTSAAKELWQLAVDIHEAFEQDAVSCFYLADNELSKYRNQPGLASHLLQNIPRIASNHLEDSARCLLHGLFLPGGALALQAVEASLRFYYNRHGGSPYNARNPPGWGTMQRFLREGGFISKDLDEDLGRLVKWRNIIAHGRPSYRLVSENIGTIFDECKMAVQGLAKGRKDHKEKLDIQLEIHWPLELDNALASYLYYWSPELPEMSPAMVTFVDHPAQPSLFKDTTSGLLISFSDGCLARQVYDQLRLQGDYTEQINPLLDAAETIFQQPVLMEPGPTINLAQAVQALVWSYEEKLASSAHEHKHQQVLAACWDLFDEFLDRRLANPNLTWQSPDLRELPSYPGLEEYYRREIEPLLG